MKQTSLRLLKFTLVSIFVLFSFINHVESFKMAIFTTGELNDFDPFTDLKKSIQISYSFYLGFNYMVNYAKVNVEKQLQTTDIDIFEGVTEHGAIEFMEEKIALGYDSFIAASLEYTNAAINITTRFPEVVILTRGNRVATKNLSYVTYNVHVCQYILGYFAGLMTKTSVLGYVNPGEPFIMNYGSNAFYVGAVASSALVGKPVPQLYLWQAGGWIQPDIEHGATLNLMNDFGADMISHTQDDMMVPITIMQQGGMALGTNGYGQREIYGEQIGLSFVTDWTTPYLQFTKAAMTNRTAMIRYYGDFNNNFLRLDNFSSLVPQDVQDKVNAQAAYLMTVNRTVNPYYCSDLNLAVITNKTTDLLPGTTNCITSAKFFQLNVPYPGMTFLGNYSVPLVKVDMDRDVQYAFSVIAGILNLVSIVFAVLVFVYRNTQSIRSASPLFCIAILIGACITYIGVIIWVQPNSDAVCSARYWLLAVGYALLVGALVVKNFRIWKIFDNPELKAVKITNAQLFPWVFAIICVKIIFLAIMTSKVGNSRVEDVFNIDGVGKYEYMSVCQMDSAGNGVLYGLLGSFAVLLLSGVFLSWKIRIVDIDEFNESKEIGNTLYAISFILFVIIPLLVSPQSNLNQSIIICASALFITTAAICILFVPKFWRIHNYGDKGTNVFGSRSKSAIASSRSKSASNSVSGHVKDADDDEDGAISPVSSGSNSIRMTTMSVSREPPSSPTASSFASPLPPFTGPVHATFDSDDTDDEARFPSPRPVPVQQQPQQNTEQNV
ncbi:G-protein-coupled receptor family 3 protein 12 [Cavenderia fasciculata]|uniref:G-protein-coupled receptor family 3 protein 12 n=1 Tax=Cavenderia fasciculata TaxID=261658 RepID=F4Q8D5_CACFS|nr:G-protein-coupled receptor family 3 protein 12 [Cavenderia fasciculata]EGG16035.1 G-protein-coupled receptor family 3 protein 12 [Cavenderia fasciculata]|eukprot:XP_004352360.1 G-protein-coupled receptor family 3 protein 12 [Cavenderia fasciculata]